MYCSRSAEPIRVRMSSLIEGNCCKFLRGLNKRKARRIEIPFTFGRKDSSEVTTTTKSSMFHGSRKYVFFDKMNPWATILTTASEVNNTA